MQQKVQFFQSESQFGSSASLQNSRILDIDEQVDMIFITLRKQFLPTKQKTNYDNIEYIINQNQKIRKKNNDIDSSRLQIAKFNQYQGQGIEGYPYFQLLSKQFRIRFKRACIKQKQLLYKNYGLQVGVITQFYSPNFIKVNVHLTNYGQKNIQNLKIKVINPNQNKIDCQINQFKILNINQQTKIPISCSLKNYPIGPVVLILEYQTQTNHDLRLLLPVHIFKCVNISQRTEKMLKPNTFSIKPEKKICKDEVTLKQYFNCQPKQEIKVKVKHQHSNSSLLLNVFYEGQYIKIQYQHSEGYNNFTEYFIKTLRTILQKLN